MEEIQTEVPILWFAAGGRRNPGDKLSYNEPNMWLASIKRVLGSNQCDCHGKVYVEAGTYFNFTVKNPTLKSSVNRQIKKNGIDHCRQSNRQRR